MPPAFTSSLEERICDSAVEFLAERLGGIATDVVRPDAENRRKEAVDRSFRVGERRIVLEHTRIEAYQGRIHGTVVAELLQEALQEELGTWELEDSRLDLMLPLQSGLSRRQIRQMARPLVDWIKRTAPALAVGGPSTAPEHFIRATPPGLNLQVTLYRWPARNFRLGITGPAPEDDELLIASVERSCRRKLPKLERTRSEAAATSVLVLEVRDLQIGDPSSISLVARCQMETDPPLAPDFVLLLDADFWTIQILREDGVWVDAEKLTERRAP